MRWDLAEHANDLAAPEDRVFCGLNALGALRKTNPAFGALADVWTLDTGNDGVLGIGRYYDGQKIIGVFNFTREEKTVAFPWDDGEFFDLLTGENHILKNLTVPPYGFYYLEQIR